VRMEFIPIARITECPGPPAANRKPRRGADGTGVATLADVRALILNEPKHIQGRGSWQHAAKLMILAAGRGGLGRLPET
jgi:hypothetical protein